MHILHIYKSFFPDTCGGVENFIKTLANGTAKLGVSNTLLTVSDKPNLSLNFSNLNIVRVKKTFEFASCPVSFQMFSSYKKCLAQADIVHMHFPWPFADLVTLLSDLKCKKKIIITYHSDIVKQRIIKQLYKPVMNRFLQSTSKIIVTSSKLLHSSDDLRNFKNKCRVIPVTTDVQSNASLDQNRMEYWRDKLGSNFLLFTGRFRYYKGLEVLLEAVKNTNIKTVLIGGGYLEEKLFNFVEKNGLSNVEFVGSVSDQDKMILLKLCRAVVLPSIVRSEAFGLCLLEGLAFGKPLISTELGTGTSYVNQHGVTGLVVPPSDPIKLREAILELFSNDALAEKMGKAAYQYYCDNFTTDKVVQQYIDCYKQLLVDCGSELLEPPLP